MSRSRRTLGCCLLALGGFVLALTFVDLKRLRDFGGLPRTPGRVTSSRLEVLPRTYLPRVAFEYSVDGAHYGSDRVDYLDYAARTPGYLLRFAAQRVLDRYPVGSEVTVHYDPRIPTLGFLEATPPYATLAAAAAALVLAVVLMRR